MCWSGIRYSLILPWPSSKSFVPHHELFVVVSVNTPLYGWFFHVCLHNLVRFQVPYNISMSLCAEKLCLDHYLVLGFTLDRSTAWVETRSSFPQQATLWVVYRQFSTVLHPVQIGWSILVYFVPYAWCNMSETAPPLTYNCWRNNFMGEELHEILQDSSNEQYIEDKVSAGGNVGIEEGADMTE